MEAQIFVGVLGASNYVYAEALPSQQLVPWVNAHAHAFEFYGGCPEIVVPDYVPRHIIGLLCPAALCDRQVSRALS
jgi:transposase